MKTNRAFVLLGVLLLVACVGLAASLDRWFMNWAGNRARDFSPLRLAIGDGQKIFAGHFYRKADVYFHSGMYPSIFDNQESFKTAHIGEDAGATDSQNTGDEATYLGRPLDLIDRFSRNFFPAQHTHLDEGGGAGELGDSSQVREILPWLKIAQELDPEEPLTYSVSAYWLRQRMGKVREAELMLREGLKVLPDHPVLLFELGRIYFQNHQDLARARNIWRHAIESWKIQESIKADPDVFILGQLLTHLAKLEEDAGAWPQALIYWEQAAEVAPTREGLPQRIAEVRQKIAPPPAPP